MKFVKTLQFWLTKHRKLFLITVMAVTGVFGVMPGAHAGWLGDLAANGALYVVGGIVQIWVWLLGQLAVQLVYLIIYLASYNNFVNSSAVSNGWVIIRDVVNMFFIIILLVIAFATIFNVKEYKYQAMLPRLLIMAVVINFSRTICGILIDFGQVVMLTFVNGFQAAAGGNFMKALKIEDLVKFREGAVSEASDASFTKVLASFVLAAILITVTVVVLGAMAIMLVMRMVALWFLVVLSPIAFLASVWPSGRLKQNYAKWWDMFLDNIIVGPLLAFFLWLSLLVLGNGDIGKTEVMDGGTYQKAAGEAEELNEPSTGYTKVGTTENMLSYLLGIGMLLGSLAMAQGMRSAGSGIAGAALGKIKQYSTAAVKKPTMWAGGKVYGRAKRTARNAAVGTLGGLSAIPGLGRLVPTKVLGGLRQAQQKQAQEDSSYVASLTPKDRERLTKRLETSPFQTDKTKNRLGALYKEELNDLSKQSWKPDKNGLMDGKTKEEWYKGKQERTAKIESFSEARASRDPDFRKKTKEFEDIRPDFLKGREKPTDNLSETPLGRAAAAMDSLKVNSTPVRVFQNDEFIEGIGKKNREDAKAHGGQARRDLIEAWEKKQPDYVPPKDEEEGEGEKGGGGGAGGGGGGSAGGGGGRTGTPIPMPSSAREVELEGGEEELELAQTPEEILEKARRKTSASKEEYDARSDEFLKNREEEVKRRQEEIKQKRLAGQEPGFTYVEIDKMLADKGITPGTSEADEYMRKWDREKANAEIQPSSISGYAERNAALQAWTGAQEEERRAAETLKQEERGGGAGGTGGAGGAGAGGAGAGAGQPAPKTPPPASATLQEKIDFVAQGGPVENVYQVDVGGNFKDDNAAGQFRNDWSQFKEVISKEQVAKLFSALSGLKGQMQSTALRSLSKNDFINYMMMLRHTGVIGKGVANEKTLKEIIRKYMSETAGSKNPGEKETREYIENSAANQYTSEGEEEKKA